MPKNEEMLCINIYPDGKVCINLDLDCKQIATAVPVPSCGCGGMKIAITSLTKPDKEGKIREYVPCKRNDDEAEGFICPETEDFIYIRPSKEDK